MTHDELTPDEVADWEARQAQEAEARRRQERLWAARHPVEWQEWLRLQPLLDPLSDVFEHGPLVFEELLKEVGRAPSRHHRVHRRDETVSYRRGNLVWTAPAPPRRDHLNYREVYQEFGLKKTALSRLKKQGRVETIEIPGASILYVRRSLEALFDAHRKPAKPLNKPPVPVVKRRALRQGPTPVGYEFLQ